MTSLATVIGLIPTALGLETGTEANRPLALAVVGGLTSSTLLSLFLVPVMFMFFAKRSVAKDELDDHGPPTRSRRPRHDHARPRGARRVAARSRRPRAAAEIAARFGAKLDPVPRAPHPARLSARRARRATGTRCPST